jgi:hypothetical protein
MGERKIMNHFVVKSYCLSIQQPKIVAPKNFTARETFNHSTKPSKMVFPRLAAPR